MKKLLALILTLTLLLCCVPFGAFNITASAATSGTTGDCTWSLFGTVLTISGNGNMGNFNNYSSPWGTSITEVIIEDGVTSIGNSAFYGCSSLTSVTIGNGVTSIGNYAFYYCSSITHITIPDGVTSIGNSIFYYCRSLTSVTLGNGVTSIGYDAFDYCLKLNKVFYRGSETDKSNINIGSSNYYLKNATWHYNSCIDSAEHSYNNACDNVCHVCDFVRTVPDHVYDSVCDAFCNECNLERTVPDHVYDGVCDAFCNECNLERTAPDHIYDNVCDAFCNTCNLERTVPDHIYDNACDAFCNKCNYERTPDVHKVVQDSAYSFENSSTYPFAFENGVYYSTNKSNNTSSTVTITALNNGSIKLRYCTSTESGFDKLTIKLNNTTKIAASGITDWNIVTLDVKQGDKIYIKYSKDSSQSSGNDRVYFKIESYFIPAEDVEPTCVEPVICSVCSVLVKEALGHSFGELNDGYTCERAFCGSSLTPTVPKLEYKYSGTVVLKSHSYMEYSLDGISWQDSNVFDGLNENTSYTFFQRVKASSVALQSDTSESLSVTLKAFQTAPGKPTAISATDNTVKLLKKNGYEYSVDGIKWQTSNVFENLLSGTEYTFYQRLAETESCEASAKSEALVLTTDKAYNENIPDAPTALEITANSITLNIVDGCEYSLDGFNWQISNVFKNLVYATEYSFYQRFAESENYFASEMSPALTVKTDKVVAKAPKIPELEIVTHNAVILKAVYGCEYSMDGENWQKSNIFKNLDVSTSYFFMQRVAESETHYASDISDALRVRTLDEPQYQKGDVDLNGTVNVSDLATLKKYIAGLLTEAEMLTVNPDVDENGTVNVSDLAQLKKIIAGIA